MERIKGLYHNILARLSTVLFGFPAYKLTVIAVTGTSGKTTTAHLIYSILKKAGKKVALISSVEAIIGGKSLDTGFHVTTPNAFFLQLFLRKAVGQGENFVVIEASSHGIAQYRMLGTNVTIAVLTNISHEHLDFHKTFKNYAGAKLSLITSSKIGLVNKDDSSFELFNKSVDSKAVILSYSLKDKTADFTPQNTESKSSLPGIYNEQNVIAASAVGQLLNIETKLIKKALSEFKGIKGRFEEIKNKRGVRLIIDFAHKPNAFEALLSTLSKEDHNRLILVFGSAGERDKGKRKMMGEIAAKYADVSILTAEDPRSEDVNKIIQEIANGALSKGAVDLSKVDKIGKKHVFVRIPDRGRAIDRAINRYAKNGDIIAFLGKGHEKSMCYGSTEYPWSEHEEINKALARK